ncbi:MAG: restriction endonuclease subunit R [Alphaproteobacteria bacterium]|nr:restriction endonuclease subunit R [Alphaproteobacteria bacterium]
MSRIPARVSTRITQQVKKFQQSIADASKRDINESDTARMVAEMIGEVMGYDKLQEITAEFAIRGAYADFAVRVKNDIRFFVEVKAANIELKESHVTQVINYGANQGVDWAILTNGSRWQAYRITYGKPVDRVLVMDIDLATATAKSDDVIEFFGNLSREVFTSSSMTQVFQAKQAMGKYSIAAILLSDPVVAMVRRELRRLADGINPDPEQIRSLIEEQVIKRELIEGDEAKAAAKAVRRALKRSLRERTAAQTPEIKQPPQKQPG